MFKPKSILILIFFALASGLRAQESIEPTQPKEPIRFAIGANTTYLIRTLVGKQDADSLFRASKYPVLVNLTMSRGRWELYTGLGGTYADRSESVQGFADADQIINRSLFAQLGIGRDLIRNGRIKCVAGVDLFFNSKVNKRILDSGIDLITDVQQEQYLGAGPKMVFQYQIADRFLIGTHLVAYARFGKSDSARIFQNFPGLNDRNLKSTSTDALIILPTQLFVTFQL
jgi:hypothetical protein